MRYRILFKQTENSTIQIDTDDLEVIQKALVFAKRYGITRVIIYRNDVTKIDYINCQAMNYPEVSIWIKLNAMQYYNIYSEYSNVNFVLCMKLNEFEKYNSIKAYKEISINCGDNISDCKYVDDLIIWNLKFDCNKWDEFDEQLKKLFELKEEIMIENILLSTSDIISHPCNVYLCSGVKCHSSHGDIPRYITVNAAGKMFPYSLMNSKLCLGSIFNENVVEDYRMSEAKKLFINANRELYLKIMDKCNYSLIPWFDLLNEVL